MWLTHLELDALEKRIFLCLVFFLLSVFPSWENLKNMIIWDIFSYPNYCSKCLRLLM